jgi:hypothetical protein
MVCLITTLPFRFLSWVCKSKYLIDRYTWKLPLVIFSFVDVIEMFLPPFIDFSFFLLADTTHDIIEN